MVCKQRWRSICLASHVLPLARTFSEDKPLSNFTPQTSAFTSLLTLLACLRVAQVIAVDMRLANSKTRSFRDGADRITVTKRDATR